MSAKLTAMFAAYTAGAIVLSTPEPGNAQAPDSLSQIRQQIQSLHENHRRQIETLEERIRELERKRAVTAAPVSRPGPGIGQYAGGTGNAFQVGLSGTFAAGGSTLDDDQLSTIQGGGHDPNKNGFTVQSAELFLGGTVDPYFDAQAHIALFMDADGETEVELEEAFMVTRALPWGLQAKAGQFLTEFGRHNTMHLHQFEFVDAPVISTRLLGGDGLRNPGARLSWLTPAPWFSEITFAVQNARGEGAKSFLGGADEPETIGGLAAENREVRNFGDLLYSARWLNGFDLSETMSVNAGLSGAWGRNSTGSGNRTSIYGADLYARWQPERTVRGFPFVSVHAEAMHRNFETGPGSGDLNDWGYFIQGSWGFIPGWVAALRFDRAAGDGDAFNDPDRDSRYRVSPALTWFPTEFSKLRLQYNYDRADHLQDQGENGAHTLWLQAEFSLGGHFAHTF